MPIPIHIYAIAVTACLVFGVAGAGGMRWYSERKRIVAESADPRDNQLRELLASTKIAKEDVVKARTSELEAKEHCEQAHARIDELLERSSAITEKYVSTEELLTQVSEEKDLFESKLTATKQELERTQQSYQELELELKISHQDDMLATGTQTGAPKRENEKLLATERSLTEVVAAKELLESKFRAAQQELESIRQAKQGLVRELETSRAEPSNRGTEELEAAEQLQTQLTAAKDQLESKLGAAQQELANVQQTNQELERELEANRAEAVTRGNEELEAAEQLQTQLTAAKDQLESKLGAAQQELANVQQTNQELERELEANRAEAVTRGNEELEAAERSLAQVTAAKTLLENKFSTAQQELENVEHNNQVLERELAASRAEAAKRGNEELEAAERSLTEVTAAKGVLETKLGAAQRELDNVKQAKNEQLVATEQSLAEMSAANEVSETKFSAAQLELESLRQARRNLEMELEASRVDASIRENEELVATERSLAEITEAKDLLESKLSAAHQELENAQQTNQELERELGDSRADAAPPSALTSDADDGDDSPSLVQCLSEEMERWKRHCKVLGNELRAQRDKLVEYEGASPEDPAPQYDADDLTAIKGIGKVIAAKLNDLGVRSFEQIASLTDDDVSRAVEVVPDFDRRMSRYDWIGQARNLAASKQDQYA